VRSKSKDKPDWVRWLEIGAACAAIIGIPFGIVQIYYAKVQSDLSSQDANKQKPYIKVPVQPSANPDEPDTAHRLSLAKQDLREHNPRAAKTELKAIVERGSDSIEVIRDYVIACEDIFDQDENSKVPVDLENAHDLLTGFQKLEKVTVGHPEYSKYYRESQIVIPQLQKLIEQKGGR